MVSWVRYPEGHLGLPSLRDLGLNRVMRAAFVTTDIEDSDIAAADTMGIISTSPSYPSNTGNPAAIGMQTTL